MGSDQHKQAPGQHRPLRPGARHRHRAAIRTGSTIASVLAAGLLVLAVSGTQVGGADGAAAAPQVPIGVLPDGVDTIFGASTQPDSNAPDSDSSVELGLRFTTVVDGAAYGLRVYRPSGQTAEQVGTLWTANGQRLAQVRLPASAEAGWQYAPFDGPVDVKSDTVYVASYHAARGYVADVGYFAGGGDASGLIRPATRAGEIDPDNGVYAYGDDTTFPDETHRSTNYWVDVAFRAAEGSGPPPSTPPSTTRPTTTQTTPPTTTTPTTTRTTTSPPTTSPPTTSPPTTSPPTTTAPPGVIPPGTLPEPGQVGFLGNPASLRVIDSPSTAPPGTTWSNGTLQVAGANVTLDRVWVRGSVDYSGSGVLTIRNSIVEANGSSWSVVLGRSSDARLDIRDSDLVWPRNVPAPGSSWGNGAAHGDAAMTLIRNDISGTPDGVQQAGGNSTFQQNYIHDLRIENETHNDGLQLYGGPNYDVSYNYIELDGYDGVHQNAALFFSDDGDASPSPEIIGNYLSGGGYQLRLEAGTTQAVVTDNVFGPLAGGFGYASVQPGATVQQWSRNVDTNGNPVPQPPTR